MVAMAHAMDGKLREMNYVDDGLAHKAVNMTIIQFGNHVE
jgi:hypothetical protein